MLFFLRYSVYMTQAFTNTKRPNTWFSFFPKLE